MTASWPVRTSTSATPALVGSPSGAPVMLIETAHGLDEEVVAGQVGTGATAEPGDGAVDDPRVVRRDLRVAEPEPVEGTAAVVLDQDVGAPGQLAGEAEVVGVLEVELDASAWSGWRTRSTTTSRRSTGGPQ